MEASFTAPHILCATVPLGTPRRWLAACHEICTRIEHLDTTTALLDIGVCTAPEAHQVASRLLARPRREGVTARAALAPNETLAQLSLLQQKPDQTLSCCMTDATSHPINGCNPCQVGFPCKVVNTEGIRATVRAARTRPASVSWRSSSRNQC